MAKNTSKTKEKIGPATIVNRRAAHEYEFLDTYEAGMVLVGSEVKSIFLGRASLTDAYCRISNNELFLFNADIEPYANARHYVHERRRDRKLLLHRREITQIYRKVDEKGLALIPYKIYFKGGKAKIEIAVARGKKTYDKRETLKSREMQRDLERELS